MAIPDADGIPLDAYCQQRIVAIWQGGPRPEYDAAQLVSAQVVGAQGPHVY